MDSFEYGKQIWVDDAPRGPAWKTALLLFVAVFSMNFIASQAIEYLAFAVLSAVVYLYFSVRTDRAVSRLGVYQNGILAPARPAGSRAPPIERFFKWSEIKSLKVETGGMMKKRNTLQIETQLGSHSADLQKKISFISSCKSLGKEISG